MSPRIRWDWIGLDDGRYRRWDYIAKRWITVEKDVPEVSEYVDGENEEFHDVS